MLFKFSCAISSLCCAIPNCVWPTLQSKNFIYLCRRFVCSLFSYPSTALELRHMNITCVWPCMTPTDDDTESQLIRAYNLQQQRGWWTKTSLESTNRITIYPTKSERNPRSIGSELRFPSRWLAEGQSIPIQVDYVLCKYMFKWGIVIDWNGLIEWNY